MKRANIKYVVLLILIFAVLLTWLILWLNNNQEFI